MATGAQELKSLVLISREKEVDGYLSRSIQIKERPATKKQLPSGMISISKRRTEELQHRA
jgi:hypothetical protein